MTPPLEASTVPVALLMAVFAGAIVVVFEQWLNRPILVLHSAVSVDSEYLYAAQIVVSNRGRSVAFPEFLELQVVGFSPLVGASGPLVPGGILRPPVRWPKRVTRLRKSQLPVRLWEKRTPTFFPKVLSDQQQVTLLATGLTASRAGLYQCRVAVSYRPRIVRFFLRRTNTIEVELRGEVPPGIVLAPLDLGGKGGRAQGAVHGALYRSLCAHIADRRSQLKGMLAIRRGQTVIADAPGAEEAARILGADAILWGAIEPQGDRSYRLHLAHLVHGLFKWSHTPAAPHESPSLALSQKDVSRTLLHGYTISQESQPTRYAAAVVHFLIACLAQQTGRMQTAVEHLAQAARLWPSFLHCQAASSFSGAVGDLEGAVIHGRDALLFAKSPWEVDVGRASLAAVYLAAGNLEGAVLEAVARYATSGSIDSLAYLCTIWDAYCGIYPPSSAHEGAAIARELMAGQRPGAVAARFVTIRIAQGRLEPHPGRIDLSFSYLDVANNQSVVLARFAVPVASRYKGNS